jgi:hypothetical protein
MALSVEQIQLSLKANYPGMFRVAVGGTLNEKTKVLTGFEVVQVPTDKDGLPATTQVLKTGWTSAEGMQIDAAAVEKSVQCGRWNVPVILNGRVRQIEGNLSLIRQQTGGLGFIFNASYGSKWIPKTGQNAGKEQVYYNQFFTVNPESPDFIMEQSRDRQLALVLGSMIAAQHGIMVK